MVQILGYNQWIYFHLCRARTKCLCVTCPWCWDSCRQRTAPHMQSRWWRAWTWPDKPSSWTSQTGHPGVSRASVYVASKKFDYQRPGGSGGPVLFSVWSLSVNVTVWILCPSKNSNSEQSITCSVWPGSEGSPCLEKAETVVFVNHRMEA